MKSAPGERRRFDHISDEDLLREVMNTVGKEGRVMKKILPQIQLFYFRASQARPVGIKKI
jgi:hypothetical protein